MEEIEKNKMTRVKEEGSNKISQLMLAVPLPNIRALVSFVNSNEIKKDDIVKIIPENDHVVLIYFK